ncbi:uncharacterized protein M6G45_014670 [Spheniscus humboldti]
MRLGGQQWRGIIQGLGFSFVELTLNALKLREQSQQLVCGLHALVSLTRPPTLYSDPSAHCPRAKHCSFCNSQYPDKRGEPVLCKPRNRGGVHVFVFREKQDMKEKD